MAEVLAGSLTEAMSMVMVRISEESEASLALKVKESEPKTFFRGVKVRFGAVPEIVPDWGSEMMVQVKVVSSGSVAVRVMSTAVSSFVARVWLSTTGGSLTGATVIEAVAILESVVPSFTLKVKESEPEKFVFGVYVILGSEPESEPWDG